MPKTITDIKWKRIMLLDSGQVEILATYVYEDGSEDAHPFQLPSRTAGEDILQTADGLVAEALGEFKAENGI